MTWTRTPTEPGLYWFRTASTRPVQVYIHDTVDGLFAGPLIDPTTLALIAGTRQRSINELLTIYPDCEFLACERDAQ